jgi:hypothetical protein
MQENQAADFYLHHKLTDPISFLVYLILLAIGRGGYWVLLAVYADCHSRALGKIERQ